MNITDFPAPLVLISFGLMAFAFCVGDASYRSREPSDWSRRVDDEIRNSQTRHESGK